MNLQPYQEASEEIKRQSHAPDRILKHGATTALSFAAGGSILGKITPFLSKYLPSDLAIKGLSRVSPGLGKFIKGSIDQGHEEESVLDFVKNKIEGSEQKNTVPDKRSIIEQYSPSIYENIKRSLQQGKPLIEAADMTDYMVYNSTFKPIIEKMEKDHNAPWLSIVKSVFGEGDTVQPNQQQAQETNQQMLPKQPQQGQASQSLMEALQRAAESRKKRSQ